MPTDLMKQILAKLASKGKHYRKAKKNKKNSKSKNAARVPKLTAIGG